MKTQNPKKFYDLKIQLSIIGSTIEIF